MNSQSNSRRDVGIAIGLFAFSLLCRIPFRSHILYHWDSVNFAYALREFDVVKEQPQPPGYILYVGLTRLVDLVFEDAQTTMVAISMVASALAVAAMFYLGRSMFNRHVGLIAALFLSTSPLFWFYGEIALPHTLDTMLVVVIAWWLYEVMRGNRRFLYLAIATLAIAGGIRQQTIVFLLPLLLLALRRVGWKHFLGAGVLGAVLCLAWFIPLMVQSDGVSNYLSAMNAFSDRFQSSTSVLMGAGWWGIQRNVRKLGMYTLYGSGAALIPGAIYLVHRLQRRIWPNRWDRIVYLLIWIAPAFLYYGLIHMGQQGLVFVFLPALLLMGAVALTRFPTARFQWVVAAAAILLMVNIGIFVLVPEYPTGPSTQRLLTRDTLTNSDDYYRDRFVAVKENFPPASTAIIASNWHHVEYYLPEYMMLPFSLGSRWETNEGVPFGSTQEIVATPGELGLQLDDRGQVVVVVFDPDLKPFANSSVPTRSLLLDHGDILEFYTLTEEQVFHYGAGTFGASED